MISNSVYKAKNSKSIHHISIIASDHYTARCRCSKNIFKSIGMNVRIGSILHIRIKMNYSIPKDENTTPNDNVYYDVMCTIWPDHSNCLEEDYFYIDDSVLIGKNPRFSWLNSTCEVIYTHQSSNLTSFHVIKQSPQLSSNSIATQALVDNKQHHVSIAKNLLGMPLSNDLCQVIIKQQGLEKIFSIKSIFPYQIGVVCTSTVAIEVVDINNPQSSTNLHPASSSQYSNISVVNEIIHRIVMPSLPINNNNYNNNHNNDRSNLNSYVKYNGLLLIGSPGVGKTYAMRAVQHFCKDFCQVHIIDVSISSLLTSEEKNPIEQLDRIFQKISFKSSSSSSSSNSSSRITNNNQLCGQINIHEIISSPSSTYKKNSIIISNTSNYDNQCNPQTPSSKSQLLDNMDTSNNTTTPTTTTIQQQQQQTPLLDINNNSSSNNISTTSSERITREKFSFTQKNYKSTQKKNQVSTSKTTNPTSTAAAVLTSRSASSPVVVVPMKEKPSFYFILFDEMDALGTPHNMHNDTQIAIKQYLCDWFDRKAILSHTYDYCLVGTSNHTAAIDQCLRRGGRFDYEISVSNTQSDRYLILQSLLQSFFCHNNNNINDNRYISSSKITNQDSLDLNNESKITRLGLKNKEEVDQLASELACHTGGYVAADLSNLIKKMSDIIHDIYHPNDPTLNDSNNNSDNNISNNNAISIVERIKFYKEIFNRASKLVTPSCLKGVSVKLPINLSYNDVIGYTHIKQKLRNILSIAHPSMNKQLRLFNLSSSLGGVMLYGPPGNSKTRLVIAAAVDHKLPLITLSAADVYSAYVGDAEAEIRKAFQIARQASPCVLFFDEIDSIVTNRANNQIDNNSSSTSASVEGRVLATLLTEMDGIITNTTSDDYNGVIVIGATNRIDFIDAALLRKGRFHHVLYVPPPNEEEQYELVKYFLTKYYQQRNSINIVHNKDVHIDHHIIFTSNVELNIHIKQVMKQIKLGQNGAEIENICKQYVLQPYL